MGVLLDEILKQRGNTGQPAPAAAGQPMVTPKPLYGQTKQVVKPVIKPQTQLQPQPSPLQKAASTYEKVGKKLQGVTQTVMKPPMAALGKVGEVLSIPSQMTEKGLTSVYSKATGNQAKSYEDIASNLGVTNKYAQTGIGLASRLVLDPLNLLGISEVRNALSLPLKALKPVGTAIKELPQVEKAVQWAKETPAVYKPLEATVAPYFRNPEAGKVIEVTRQAIRGKVNELFHLVDESAKGLTPAQQVRVGQLIEGSLASAKTEPRLVEVANQFKTLAKDIGQQAVDTGLLNKEAFTKMTESGYMPHAVWEMATNPETANQFLKTGNVPKISGQFFQQRKGAEGYVKSFAPNVFKGLGTEISDIEAAKMFKNIGEQFGKAPTAELAQKGYQMADLGKAKGQQFLKDKMLPQEVVDYLKKTMPAGKTDVGKVIDTLMGTWKKGKTIWNPAYHVRNIVSNQILSHIQTGESMPKTLANYVDSVAKYLGKGDQTFVNEAIKSGVIKNKYFGEGVEQFTKNAFKPESKTIFQKILSVPGNVDKKLAEFQSFSEDTAKLNVFSHFRKEGLTAEEATAKAQEAIFSPYQINPVERSTMGKAIPFYSFTRQAAPFIAKNIVTNPQRFTSFPKYEKAIESLSTPQDKKYMPDYMKEMVRTPFKNEKGQQKYSNLQYFYPWGSFFGEEGPNMGVGQGQLPLGLGINPAVSEAFSQLYNYDPYFGTTITKPGQPPSEQLKARGEHVARTFLPTAYTTAGKVKAAVQGRPDYMGRERSLQDLILGEGLGIKLYPYDKIKGIQNYTSQINQIDKDLSGEINSVIRDQSLKPVERKQKLTDLIKWRNDRLQKLTK